MLRATTIIRKAAVRPERIIDTVVLDRQERQQRRIALKGEGGIEVLLDLEGAGPLNDGDAVKVEDGRLIAVRAAAQALLEVRAENPARLLRAAWQVGLRQRLAEITADALYIDDDPALAELVRGQGCTATPLRRPFEPEVAVHACGPDCDHDHSHAHAHGHTHAHGAGHHGRGHTHAADHHGHAHDHDH